MLTTAELSRYSRQLVLPELGVAGQERLRAAQVVIVGAGGLGSPAALYLAAAGVGTIGIVDDDVVDVTNLHRQIIHRTADVGRDKARSAAGAIAALNPNVRVNAHNERLTPASALSLFAEYDLVVDGSDNYPTRYAINDACAKLEKPWIYGSVERFSGQVSVFDVRRGPCYRCVFPEAPSPGSTASCEEIGVLGAVPGVIGSLQAVEALKWIAGVGEPLVGRLLQLDFQRGSMSVVQLEKRAGCRACSCERSRDTVGTTGDATGAEESDIEPAELTHQLRSATSPLLLDIREPWEWNIGCIGDPLLVRMGELERNVSSLDRSRELVVYCHHGMRSGVAAEWLRAQGFRARSLAGGIDRWSREVDSSVPRY